MRRTTPKRRFPRVLLALALAATAVSCNGDDDDDGDAAGPTTTTAGATTTSDPSATSTTAAGPTTTTVTTPDPELVRCTNPEGFTIAFPRTWVQEGCSSFHREPFEPPGATDERVAAITAYVDPVPLDVVIDPEGAQNLDRTMLEIDGRRAVRLSYVVGGESLYPTGTPITLYAVDVGAAPDGQARTLLVDTVGLTGFEYEDNVEIVDRMAPSVEITG